MCFSFSLLSLLCSQYAFIQTSPNNQAGNRTSVMSATLMGLSTSSTYYVSFYVGVRLGGTVGEVTPNVTQSQVTLTYGSQTLWTSVQNIADSSGYMFVQTSTFTPSAASALFSFTVVSTVDIDHSILIDAVIVNPTVALPNATLAVGMTNTFEYPPIAGNSYDYNTPVTTTQPWTWTSGLGGRAMIGSPFDPPPPSTPPSGSQYAFVQTSPNGANFTSASMSAIITGLSSTTSYFVSFYWALRAQSNTAGGDIGAGNQTQSSFSVLVNGQVVYASAQNLNDSGGWIYTQTVAWQPVAVSNGQATVSFYVTSTTLQDHTVLFDDITVSLAGAIALPSLQDFESPYTSYVYNPPVTPQQPWTWNSPTGGGIGHTGGPWDPPAPIQPPSNAQYAYLQTGGTGNHTTWMSATLFNLTSGVTYTVSFYYATRAATTTADYTSTGNQTQSQLTLLINGQQVWQSVQNISDMAGWLYVAPVTFTGTGNVPIMFYVTSIGSDDHAILIDAVQFTSSLPTPTYFMYTGITYNFENPSLAFTSPYQYNPPTSVFQPFTWPMVITNVRNGGGGLAQVGGPWDPPAPSTPPSGTQYAFIQTSANSFAGLQLSNMSAVAQLSGNQNYYITFYFGARAANNDEVEPGWQTQSTLSVTVNGITVWTSGPNITDVAGWTYAQTSTFPGVQGPDAIYFIVQSTSNDDHAILIDAITIVAGTAPSLSSSAGGSPGYPPIVFRQGGIIVPDTLYDFETPAANSPQYAYCPNITTSPAQPWSFPLNPSSTTDFCLGGVAQSGSPFDPPPPTTAPNNIQYAFIQTSPNGDYGSQTSYMTAQLTQLTPQAQYTLQFYWAIRADKTVSDTTAGNVTQSLYSISYAGNIIYTSPSNLVDAGGWAPISVPFTASAASGNLIFNVTSLVNQDHSLLFDAVMVRSAAGPAAAFVQAATQYSFEYPQLSVGSQVQYYYNPQQTVLQPWAWYVPAGSFQGQGGVAAAGSPFDPPPPSTPPQGTQYGFVQVTPTNGGSLFSWMSANVSGLTANSNYYLSFYWAIRVQTVISDDTPGNVTSASFVVTLGGTTIYSSPTNLSDAGGWTQVYSNTFSAPNGIAPLTFTVTATAAADHALLFDNVQVTAGTSPGGGTVTPSSSTGSNPVSPTSSPSSTATIIATSSPAATSTNTVTSTPSTASTFVTSSSVATASGTTGVVASGGSSGLSHGAIAGIVIGSVVGALIICVVLFLLCAGGRRGKKAAREDGSSEPSHNNARWEQQEEGETTTHRSGDEVEMQ